MKIAEVKKIAAREEKNGYTNGTVFGGFAQFLQQWSTNLEANELTILAEAYLQGSIAQRSVVLQDILAALESITESSENEEQAVAAAEVQQQTAGIKGLPGHAPSLATPIQYVKNIGPKRAAIFQRLDLHTVEDLLFFFPRDYQDRSVVTAIKSAPLNEMITVAGTITHVEELQPNSRISLLKVLIKDETGSIALVWFNQKFLNKQMVLGEKIFAYGKITEKYNKLELMVSDYQLVGATETYQGTIVPIYPGTEGLNPKTLRKTVAAGVEKYAALISEILPEAVLAKRKLMNREQAVRIMHQPRNFTEQDNARQRLAYEELFLLQTAVIVSSAKDLRQGIAHQSEQAKDAAFLSQLPYQLTAAQVRVMAEIFTEMEQKEPMARLVQGDVGSGKTVVAAACLYKAVYSGYQAALMVPTEILAEQHFQVLEPLLSSLGVKVSLFTGKLTGKAREKLLAQIAAGEIDVLIGTHTLIQGTVTFQNLSLAITDEQHRFGVMQRAKLEQKGWQPDVLVMTATPIPRTLALTLYGDLHLSVIDQLPPGRKPIDTIAVDYNYEPRVFKFLAQEVEQGRQCFVVCPLVEESEKTDLQSAIKLAGHLQEDIFPQLKIGLLYGKMKPTEKNLIMTDFRDRKIDILVSTTVIEVGINIPNASVMLVRDAERFGLAQLHQLRGRIGRGSEKSYCILMHNAKSQVARKRMQIMATTTDGFKIAEADLELRGPGEFFGLRQHGLPQLKVANLYRDNLLLQNAREDVLELLATGEDISELIEYATSKYSIFNN